MTVLFPFCPQLATAIVCRASAESGRQRVDTGRMVSLTTLYSTVPSPMTRSLQTAACTESITNILMTKLRQQQQQQRQQEYDRHQTL